MSDCINVNAYVLLNLFNELGEKRKNARFPYLINSIIIQERECYFLFIIHV